LPQRARDKATYVKIHSKTISFGRCLLPALGLGSILSGCGNSPYPAGLAGDSVYFMSQADDPRKLDPVSSYRTEEGTILDVICPSYYEYHPLKTKTLQLMLVLGAKEAKREPYPTTDAKGKPVKGEQWTFTVRRDLKFQDDPCFPGGKGRAISAKDFLYAFRRMADPANGSPVLNFFSDKIIGFSDLVERNSKLQKAGKSADYTTPVPGLELDPKDPYTFRVLLNQPFPQLRYLMAMHFTTPMAPEAIAFYGKDIIHHPVGCGAFVLQEWKPKQRLVLVANPNRPAEYFPSDGDPGAREAGLLKNAGKRLPLSNKVVVSTIPEGTTGWNLFLQGYMDSWGVTQTNFQQVMTQQGSLSGAMKEHDIRLVKADILGIHYFAFNMRDPVVGGYTPQKRKLRQAISLAVNSQEFINLFNQGNGLAAQSLIPPGIFGYDAKYRNPYRAYNPDLKRAKELLKEAGYPGGIDPKSGDRLTIYYDNAKTDAAGRQYVGLITKQIEALGVHLESRSQRDVVWQNKLDGNDWQFTDYGWYADYPDAENFTFLLYGPNLRPGPNLTGYDNPEYNRLFKQMRAMDDGPARQKLIDQMRAITQEDCPYVYLQHDQTLGLSYNWLSPGKPMPIGGTALKFRSVDGAKRAALQAKWNRPVVWPIALFGLAFLLGSLPAVQVIKHRHGRRVTSSSDAPVEKEEVAV
jgi:oligopeptide transport system substrate-binding protein